MKKYQFTKFNAAAFGIVLNEHNEVLLCHRRDKDLWNLPGGALESGEAPWETVVRELKEETGLEVSIDKFVGVYSTLATSTGDNQLTFTYLCKIIGGALKKTDESNEVRYFSHDELPAATFVKNVEHIKDYFSATGFPVQKKQGRGN